MHAFAALTAAMRLNLSLSVGIH